MIDLNAPLGMAPPPKRRRLPALLAGGCAALAATAFAYTFAVADPHGGEPYAVAALPPMPAAPPSPVTPSAPPPATAAQVAAAAPAPSAIPSTAAAYGGGTLENGVRVYRGAPPAAAGSAGPTAGWGTGPLVIDVSRQLGLPPRAAPAQPDAAASGASVTPPPPPPVRGERPSPAEPAPSPAAAEPARTGVAPRVALLVGNMGLSQPATEEAIALMPPEVALAFLPYGGRLEANVAAAREKRHEVLLQVPMENGGAPSPGPHALRAGEGSFDLSADLNWLLGRFRGFAGLSNLLGAPVTADPAAMDALAAAAAARGLFLASDGTSGRSVEMDSAARAGVPAVEADVLLDATSDPAAVRRNFERLVAVARRKGQAVGVLSGLAEHLPLLGRLAAELRAQNIALVPLGTLARRTATVATITR